MAVRQYTTLEEARVCLDQAKEAVEKNDNLCAWVKAYIALSFAEGKARIYRSKSEEIPTVVQELIKEANDYLHKIKLN